MARFEKRIFGAVALCASAFALSGCGGSSSNSQAVSTTTPTIFYAHSVAFSNNTTVLSWGYNGNGQLGIGNADSKSTPVTVSAGGGYPTGLKGVTDFAVGGTHTLAFKNLSGASMVAWGNNANGQLGDGDTKVQALPVNVLRAAGTPLISVKAVAAGGLHSLALRRDGTVWGWGYNGFGQLGNNTTVGTSYATLVAGPGTPGIVDPVSPLSGVAAGGSHSLAWDDSGRVWAWGYNAYGQLGIGDTTDRFAPVYILDRIPVVSGAKIIAVAAGGSTSLALDDAGNIYAWGYNAFGQAAVQPPADPAAPQYVLSPHLITGTTPLPFFTKISVGLDHCLALDASGNVWSWGYNGYGQLGYGTVESIPSPTAHPTPQQVTGTGLPQFKDIRAIGHHSIAVDTTGKVWAWGYNAFSQLGDATTISRSQPRLVNGY